MTYEGPAQPITTYKVIDSRDKGGCPEPAEPLVVFIGARGEGTLNVREVVRRTGDLWHPAVRVAIERWRHIIMYHEHFERPGHYKVAHPDWVNVAEEQLRAIGSDGSGIAQKARQVAIKPHDAWVFKVVLGSGMDRRLLLHAHAQIGIWRGRLQEIRRNGLSEEEAVKKLVQSIEEDYRLLAAERRTLLVHDFERSSALASGSPHLPAATLPLTEFRMFTLDRLVDHYLFLECDSRDDMGQEVVERALSRMPEDLRLEMALSGFMPWWRCAPLLPSPGPTKLDLLLGFFKSKTTVARSGASRRGGWHYLIGRSERGLPRGIPRLEELSNAFDEWRFGVDTELLKKHRRRSLRSSQSYPIAARYLFPQVNTYPNPT